MSKKVADSVFREYDIRGIVEKDLPIEASGDLTHAILTYFLSQKPDLTNIIIGMDGRTHAPEIKKYVINAAHSLGLNVTDIGTCPTPVFYFSLFKTDTSSGLMITASHNPKEYNGIKICLNKKSVWGKEIKKIREIYKHKTFACRKENKAPTVTQYDALGAYITWLAKHFAHLKNKSINAVIDCGNGTAGTVFPKLIETMGFKNTKLLYEEVDGNFPNHEADPTTLKNMRDVQQILLANDTYSVGIGLDGDCDRMNPMTKAGVLVPGDKLLAIYSKKIVKEHPRAPIVFDIKSSDALVQALTEMGAKPCIAPSGHSIVKSHLRKRNAKLAGELSCHFFFNDRYFGYDDGIYAALRLFELLDESEESLDQMIAKLPPRVNSPEYRIACAEKDKADIVAHVIKTFESRDDMRLLTIDGVRAQTPYGWGLIRASNTQAVVCLRFESETHVGLQQIEQDFVDALQPYFSQESLKEHFE